MIDDKYFEILKPTLIDVDVEFSSIDYEASPSYNSIMDDFQLAYQQIMNIGKLHSVYDYIYKTNLAINYAPYEETDPFIENLLNICQI